jgi:hypothetical protein
MAQKQKELAGILFRNDKGDNPSRPDYRGSATVQDTVYKLSAWIKNGTKGPFLSVSFTEDEDAENPSGDAQAEIGF